MGRALIGCCPVATANQSSPHSGPIHSNIFRSVSQEFCPKGCLGPGPGGRLGGWPGGLQVYTPGGGWLSRPTSGGGGLGGLAGGSPGLHPGGRLGLKAHTCGRLEEVWQGVSRPTPGKVSKPRPGGGVQTQAQGWYTSYWNAFLLCKLLNYSI